MLRLARRVAAQALHLSGLLRLIVNSRLKNRCLVITYHRILDSARAGRATSNPGIVVADDAFEMQMRTLRRYFNPISLRTFHAHLESGQGLPPLSCLVTFDDGWLDNFEVAFPILKKHDIPAVIFLPVDYISSTAMFWQEEALMRLSSLLEGDADESHAHLKSLLDMSRSSRTPTIEDIEQSVIDLKSLDYAQLEQRLEAIREATPDIAEYQHYNRYLSWEQVAEMKQAGIDFASHGLSHRILSSIPVPQCREELEQSRKTLESQLGAEVRAIAYPNGGFNDRVVEETARAGYALAFTTRAGFVTSDTDPLLIPRINIHTGNSDTEARFICSCARVL